LSALVRTPGVRSSSHHFVSVWKSPVTDIEAAIDAVGVAALTWLKGKPQEYWTGGIDDQERPYRGVVEG